MLPTAVDNDWVYSQTVFPKFTVAPVPPTSSYDYVTRKVLKVWNDDGHKDKRLRSVTVQLLRDGAVYDTVTLTEANNWRYTWNMLDNRYSWAVVEEVPADYTVEIFREGITFVVTNTYVEDIPDEPPTESGDSENVEIPPEEPTSEEANSRAQLQIPLRQPEKPDSGRYSCPYGHGRQRVQL